MKSQAEGYIRAVQWNLHYYYNGVCSWGWYYPHHYAPYISDIKNFSNVNLSLDFELGTPFKPFEQVNILCHFDAEIALRSSTKDKVSSDLELKPFHSFFG